MLVTTSDGSVLLLGADGTTQGRFTVPPGLRPGKENESCSVTCDHQYGRLFITWNGGLLMLPSYEAALNGDGSAAAWVDLSARGCKDGSLSSIAAEKHELW